MSPRGKALNPDEHWPDPEVPRSESQVSRGTADKGKRFLAVQAEALAEEIRDKAL